MWAHKKIRHSISFGIWNILDVRSIWTISTVHVRVQRLMKFPLFIITIKKDFMFPLRYGLPLCVGGEVGDLGVIYS